jgi:HEXXH motif-containing protein
MHLNIIMGLDSVILNDASERYFSPAKIELRPMKGIFHAHFVFYRLIYMYLKAGKVFNPKNKPLSKNISIEELDANIAMLPWEYKRRLLVWIHKFKQGEEIIVKHAKLTKIGEQLFEKMSENFLKMIN